MSKHLGSSLVFTEDDVKSTRVLLMRLIRTIFFGLGITNNDYIDRYHEHQAKIHDDKSQKEIQSMAVVDRKVMIEQRDITFKKLSHIAANMGYDIECVSVRLRDTLTKETIVFSTDDDIETLKLMSKKAGGDIEFEPIV